MIVSLFTYNLGAQDDDLEAYTQDFVLSTQQIFIPEYPHAFNPSIIRWKGTLLMSFRYIAGASSTGIDCSAESRIGLVLLNDDFTPQSEVQILDLCKDTPFSRPEDARLLISGGNLYLVYNDNIDEVCSLGGFRMHIAELGYDGEQFCIFHQERLTHFQQELPWRREKNWVPFDFQGSLLMAYSLAPHEILFPILGTETCTMVAWSNVEVNWKWGELRGGTPAVFIGDRYLSIFHSSKEMISNHSDYEVSLHYFMGAYTFSPEPPFQIKEISPEPIIGKGFYKGAKYPPYWKAVNVVFPCGLLWEGPYIWVAYGRQDHEIWIAKIDKQQLLNSLAPVP